MNNRRFPSSGVEEIFNVDAGSTENRLQRSFSLIPRMVGDSDLSSCGGAYYFPDFGATC